MLSWLYNSLSSNSTVALPPLLTTNARSLWDLLPPTTTLFFFFTGLKERSWFCTLQNCLASIVKLNLIVFYGSASEARSHLVIAFSSFVVFLSLFLSSFCHFCHSNLSSFCHFCCLFVTFVVFLSHYSTCLQNVIIIYHIGPNMFELVKTSQTW